MSGSPTLVVGRKSGTKNGKAGEWVGDGRVDGFFQLPPAGMAHAQTRLTAWRDDGHLHLSFRCQESEMGKISGNSMLEASNSVEVFIDPAHGHASYHHAIVQLDGKSLCERIDYSAATSVWTPELKVKVKTMADGWIAEISIPFPDLTAAPIREGDVWGINFVRTRLLNQRQKPEYSTWAPFLTCFRMPELFGHLAFGKAHFSMEGFFMDKCLVGGEVRAGILLEARDDGNRQTIVKTSVVYPSGRIRRKNQSAGFGKGERRLFAMDFGVEESGKHRFEVEVSAKSGKRALYRASHEFDAPPVVEMRMPQFFYYENERPGQAEVKLNLAGVMRQEGRLEIKAQKEDSAKVLFSATHDAPTGASLAVPLALGNLEAGTYRVTALWRAKGGKVLGCGGTTFYKHNRRDGRFLLLRGVEVSKGFINRLDVVMLGVEKERGLLENERKLSFRDASGSGRLFDSALKVVCHPDFLWGATAEELLKLPPFDALEVYNDPATTVWTGSWDVLLSHGRRVWAIACDDTHNLHSHAGHGWIMARAEGLDLPLILKAIAQGDFYATNGPVIDDIRCDSERKKVFLKLDGEKPRRIVFRGKEGKALANMEGLDASYEIKGNELYVRAEVIDLETGKRAWTQPLFVEKGRLKNPYSGRGRWFKGNLHTHTTCSGDGEFTPHEVVEWYKSHGYDFLAITDHNHFTT